MVCVRVCVYAHILTAVNHKRGEHPGGKQFMSETTIKLAVHLPLRSSLKCLCYYLSQKIAHLELGSCEIETVY